MTDFKTFGEARDELIRGWEKKQTYIEREKAREAARLDNILGGWKAYGLKHPKPGEYKYNVVFTDGRFFRTNDIDIFRGYLLEL